MSKNRLIQSWSIFALGIAISLGLLTAAAYHLDWTKVAGAIRTARLWPWMPLAVVSYILGHFVRGVRTRLLVSRDAEMTVATATSVVVVGYAVNNILPARLGELARAGMLTERTGLPVAQSLTVTILERVLDGWILVLFLVATIAVIPVTGAVHEVAIVASIVFVVVTIAVLFVLLAPNPFIGLVSRVTSRLPDRWHDRMIRFSMEIVQGLAYLRRPADAFRVIGLTAIVWTFEAGLFFFLLPAFGIAMHPGWAFLALTVTNLGILVPSTPGYVVVFHFFCREALRAVGIAGEVAVSYSVFVHLGFFVPVTLWGVGIILWYGTELGNTIALARKAKRLPFSVSE